MGHAENLARIALGKSQVNNEGPRGLMRCLALFELSALGSYMCCEDCPYKRAHVVWQLWFNHDGDVLRFDVKHESNGFARLSFNLFKASRLGVYALHLRNVGGPPFAGAFRHDAVGLHFLHQSFPSALSRSFMMPCAVSSLISLCRGIVTIDDPQDQTS